MAKKRKYDSYVKMYRLLKKDGLKHPGPTVNLLLDTFLERSGTLLEEHCIEAGVLKWKNKDGTIETIKFSDLRRQLEIHGWLIYDKNWAIQTRRYSEHKPGQRLHEFLNKEKAKLHEMATKDYVDLKLEEKADKADLEALRKEVMEMKGCLGELVEYFDPPSNDLKVAKYSKNPGAMLRLISTGKPLLN